MKKVLCLALAAIMTIGLVACGSSAPAPSTAPSGGSSAPAASSGKEIVWKLGTIYNDPAAKPDYNSFGEATQKFVDIVNEKAAGKLKIEPYYSSVLGSSAELWGGLRDNEVQVFYGQPMSTADARFGSWNIPYMMSSYDQVRKIIANPDAPLFKVAQQWMEEDGVHLVAIGSGVFRGLFNIKHEVATVDQVRDLKLRTYEDKIVAAFWGDICNATQMPFSEVYNGMQTKAVEGLEFAATSVLSSKYYEIANPSYYTDINWQWTSGCNLVVSQEAWDELSDDVKAIVEEAAWEAQELFYESETANEAKALDDLAKNGTVIKELSDEERQTWIDYARSLDAKFEEAVGTDVWNQIWDALK